MVGFSEVICGHWPSVYRQIFLDSAFRTLQTSICFHLSLSSQEILVELDYSFVKCAQRQKRSIWLESLHQYPVNIWRNTVFRRTPWSFKKTKKKTKKLPWSMTQTSLEPIQKVNASHLTNLPRLLKYLASSSTSCSEPSSKVQTQSLIVSFLNSVSYSPIT